MPSFRLQTVITAPIGDCFTLSLSVDAHTASMSGAGERAIGGVTSGVMGPGDTVTWRARHFGIVFRMTSAITQYEYPSRFIDEQRRGPFRRWRHEHLFTVLPDGAARGLMAPRGASAASDNLLPGQRDTWAMEDHQVVAVILRRGDQLLLCHRSPGRRWFPDVWDFPGGHVEPGERPEDALRREVAEELGAELEGVDGGPVLHRVVPHAALDLTVWVSWRWRGTVSNLQPEEHDAIGWFEEGQLDELRFADPSYLPVLRRLLSS